MDSLLEENFIIIRTTYWFEKSPYQ